MKKEISFVTCLLFAMTMLYPVGSLVTYTIGYVFKLTSTSVFAVLLAVLSVCTVALYKIREFTPENKAIHIFLSLLAPLSLINAAFLVFERPSFRVILSVAVCAGCCCYLTLKYGSPVFLRRIALILFVLMILPVCFWSFICVIFGNFGQITVVQSVDSPNGKYYAEVIDSDQGALGGDTVVNAYKKGIDLLFFKIEKRPKTVYRGEWGEFENMKIYWKDDRCLVINSVEYKVE